jgi:hypothetical protein
LHPDLVPKALAGDRQALGLGQLQLPATGFDREGRAALGGFQLQGLERDLALFSLEEERAFVLRCGDLPVGSLSGE